MECASLRPQAPPILRAIASRASRAWSSANCWLSARAMPHVIGYLYRRIHAALPVLQHAQGLLHPATASVAVQQMTAAVDHQLLDRQRSQHSASCTHEHTSRQTPATFEEQEATCWSCHDRFHRGGLVCQACDKIQPSDPTLSYFDLLG